MGLDAYNSMNKDIEPNLLGLIWSKSLRRAYFHSAAGTEGHEHKKYEGTMIGSNPHRKALLLKVFLQKCIITPALTNA